MKRRIPLASLFVLIVCACNASTGTPTTNPRTATLDVQIETPSVPVAAYVPQPAETAVTPKWNGPQVSCAGKPFDQWGSPGTYLYQNSGGFFTLVLKPGEAIPKLGVSVPDVLSGSGTEDVTTGLGTFRATHLSAGRDYSILTGRLDYVKGTCQRHEWHVCGYGLVKLTSSDSGVKTPGNYSYSSRQDFGLVSFTPLTTNEAHIRYILADIQLGNVADDYRANSVDEETAEALRRWDAGVRVTNSAEFERRIRHGRWYVVYTGTEKPVNGVDIDLSGDPN